jgi:non-specific serine/threonine protein kinase
VVFLLIALIEKSLVVTDEDGDRYRMLETVREYARDTIEGTELDKVRLRHATFFVALASEWQHIWQDSRATSDWFDRMDTDHANLLEAHAACGAYGELAEMGLDIVSGASQYWAHKGLLTLAWQLLTEALARSGAQRAGPSRCKALCELGAIALFLGRYDEGERACCVALTIARTLSDESWVAYVLRNEVAILNARGELDKARRSVREYLDIAQRVGGRHSSNARRVQAELLRREGNLAGADELTLGNLDEARAADNVRGVAICLINLGFSAVQRADARKLHDLLVELLELQVVSLDPRYTVCALELCAGLAALVTETKLVARFHGAAEAHALRFGYRLEPVDSMAINAVIAPGCPASGASVGGLSAATFEDVPAILLFARDWLASAARVMRASVPVGHSGVGNN